MSEEIQNALLETGHVKISKKDEIAQRATMDVEFKICDVKEKIVNNKFDWNII